MINLLRKIQIKLVLLLWGKIPIRTKVLFYKEDRNATYTYWWIKKEIHQNYKDQKAWLTDKRFLLFEKKWIIFIIPLLTYKENDRLPVDLREF